MTADDASEAGDPTAAATEGWGWHLARASALVLFVLLPIELISWVLAPDVADHDAEWVARRWSSPTWRVLDWVVLVLAVGHGAYGLVRLVDSGVRSPSTRAALTALVVAVSIALVVTASYTVLTFAVT